MRKATLCALVVAGLVGGAVLPSPANVRIARKENKKCVTCHLRMGAPELNDAGHYYAQHGTLEGFSATGSAKPTAPQKPAPTPKPAVPQKPAPPAKPAPSAEPAAPEAPAAPAPERLLIYRYKIDPAKFLIYEEALQGWVQAAREARLGKEFTWSVGQSGPFTYWIFMPLTDFHRLDPRSDLTRALEQKFFSALGTERVEALQAKGRPGIRSGENWVVESVPELSYAPTGGVPEGQPRYAHVDIEQVRFDQVEDYEELIQRLKEILRQADYPRAMHVYRSLTGPENTYYIVFPARDRAELFEHYRFTEEVLPVTVGEEAWAQLIADWAECIAEFEHYDEVMRPDLSYRPETE